MSQIKKYLYISGILLTICLIGFVVSLTYNEIIESQYSGLNNPRSIDVSAEETLYEKPDEAKITFSVITQNEDYNIATTENNEKMQKVSNYLKQEGIKEENLKTQSFSVSPRYKTVKEEFISRQEIIGYEVENNLLVTVKDLDKIDSLISGAINAGANKVSGLVFEVSNKKELEKQAREKAIKKAREKAKKITDDLGVKIVRVLNYSESGGYVPFRAYDMAEGMKSANVPIQSGENEIKSNVTITFEIR